MPCWHSEMLRLVRGYLFSSGSTSMYLCLFAISLASAMHTYLLRSAVEKYLASYGRNA